MFASLRRSASHSAKTRSTTLPRWLCSRMPIPEPAMFHTSSCTWRSTSSGSVPGPAEKLKIRPEADFEGFTFVAAAAAGVIGKSPCGPAILHGRDGGATIPPALGRDWCERRPAPVRPKRRTGGTPRDRWPNASCNPITDSPAERAQHLAEAGDAGRDLDEAVLAQQAQLAVALGAGGDHRGAGPLHDRLPRGLVEFEHFVDADAPAIAGAAAVAAGAHGGGVGLALGSPPEDGARGQRGEALGKLAGLGVVLD